MGWGLLKIEREEKMFNYILEFGVFYGLMMALTIKNLMQLVVFKDKSAGNYFQMLFFFLAASAYAFLKPLLVEIMPFLIGVTAILFLMLLLEAITVGENRKAYRILLEEKETKDDKKDTRARRRKTIPPVPKKLKLAWFTFSLNLLTFLVAILQITGILSELFPGAVG